MAILASEVITKARYTLADGGGTRWPDERMVSLLNDGLLIVALMSRLYSDNFYLSLVAGKYVYDLSESTTRLNRLEWNGRPIEFKSYEYMDRRFGHRWLEAEGTDMIFAVSNKFKPGQFRIYPKRPTNTEAATVVDAGKYGIVDTITYDFETEIITTSVYGALDSVDNEGYLHVYHNKKPAKVAAITSTLDDVINSTHVTMLAHYLVGGALRDNMDTQNKMLGAENIQVFYALLEQLNKDRADNNVQASRQVPYNGFV